MRPVLRSVLVNAGYPAFYLAAMAVFFHVTFPDQQLAERIESEFNSRQPLGEGTRLDVGHASPYWFSGIKLEGVRLIDTKAEEEKDDADVVRSSALSSKQRLGAAKSPTAPGASASAGPSASAVPLDSEKQPGSTTDEPGGMVIDQLTVSVSILRAGIPTARCDATPPRTARAAAS